MNIDKSDTAVVFIDPQNEVLSEGGLAWPLVRESLHENNTIENMERIFKAAKARGFEVFISPHYFYPTDKGWKFNGALETDEATSGMFARKGVLNLEGFAGSGADWSFVSSPISRTARRSSLRPIASGVRRPTTSYYNCASAGLPRSFSAEC